MSTRPLKEIKPHFDFLFDMGFKVLDTKESEFFGDYFIILGSDDFRLRFVSDRGQRSVDIASAYEDGWFDLNLVRGLLGRGDIMEVSTYETMADFLKQDYASVKILFENRNLVRTKGNLKELGKRRAKKMFPQIGDQL